MKLPPDRRKNPRQTRGRWPFVMLSLLAILGAGAGIATWTSFGRTAARHDLQTDVVDGNQQVSADILTVESAGRRQPPDPVPEGMVWVPGGKFIMGGEATFADAQPHHEVEVDGFWIDRTEVTNAQFARFVGATGYLTIAEQVPKAEDYPGATPESLVAGSIVFSPPDDPADLAAYPQWWIYQPGADLRCLRFQSRWLC